MKDPEAEIDNIINNIFDNKNDNINNYDVNNIFTQQQREEDDEVIFKDMPDKETAQAQFNTFIKTGMTLDEVKKQEELIKQQQKKQKQKEQQKPFLQRLVGRFAKMFTCCFVKKTPIVEVRSKTTLQKYDELVAARKQQDKDIIANMIPEHIAKQTLAEKNIDMRYQNEEKLTKADFDKFYEENRKRYVDMK